ncbi:MAG: LysR family transcriptional regulator [Lautropia sp.]
MKVSTVQLDAFLALAETLRFSEAAQRCHVSPSAFSQIISRLEDEVGARLFSRDTRNVSLTAEGEVFAQGARRITAEIRTAMGELSDRVAGRTGQVGLAAAASLCAAFLPSVMATFRASHPNVTVRLHDDVSAGALERVRQGHADLGLVTSPGDPREFHSTLLFDEPFRLLCPGDDALARRASVALEDLKGRTYIQMISSGNNWERLQQTMARAGLVESGIAVAYFSSLAGLVVSGFGVGFVPRIASPLCERAGLAVRPVRDPGFTRSVFLVHRRDRSLSVAAARVAEAVTGAARSLARGRPRGRRSGG